MERITKIFRHHGAQAVRLPRELEFAVDRVYVRREGENLILSPRPLRWDERQFGTEAAELEPEPAHRQPVAGSA
ncbi:MAG: antitoxin [Burkholderiaceae bacterium]